MSSWKMPLAVAACAALALAGCGSSDDPSAAPESSEPVADEALLDTGDYPTAPQEPFGEANSDEILDFESQRLAEYLPLPFEMSPELTERGSTPLQTIRASAQVYGGDAEHAINKENVMGYGFIALGQTPSADSSQDATQKQFRHQVTRFLPPGGADKTADELKNYYLTGEVTAEGAENAEPPSDLGTSIDVPGHPEARAIVRKGYDEGKLLVISETPRGEYLYTDVATVPEAGVQWALETIAHTIDIQNPVIDQFYGAETTWNPRPEGAAKINRTIDQDHVLIYAIPDPDDDSNMAGAGRAVYGPRGMAQYTENQKAVYDALTEAGAEHNAMWDTTVYRAADDAKAEKLFDELVRIELDGGAHETEPPVGLPNATCIAKAESSGMVDTCYVRNGRYIGSSWGLDDKEKAHQQISAQYLILKQADQNA